MTTSLAAVFIPILFMSGILGRLFREFAVTITAAILISGVVSVTLTPMLCSRFLRVVHTQEGLRRADGSRVRRAARTATSGAWRSCCATGWRCSSSSSPSPRATVHMFSIVPTGFIPDQDNDSMFVNLQAAQGTSFYDMSQVDAAGRRHRHPEQVRRLVHGQRRRRPAAAAARTTAASWCSSCRARSATMTAQQIAQQLRPQLLRFPGFRGFVGLPPSLQIGGRMGNQNFSIMMQSMNTDELYAWAPKLEQAIEQRGAARCRTSPPTWR